MKRSDALRIILENISDNDIALFTTGFISREAFFIKDRRLNFYMVGSMGLLSSFGLGISLNTKRNVFIIEGDGSLLMGLATIPFIGFLKPKNLVHIVLDNMVYESTGGQKTISEKIDIEGFARVSNYPLVATISSEDKLKAFLLSLKEGPIFLLVKIEREKMNKGRVEILPEKIKDRFKEAL